jgi:hypothetical protein
MRTLTKSIDLAIALFALTSLTLLPKMQAVNPPPDGGYPNFTTAEGTNALQNLGSGAANTALGWYSLFTDSSGSFNTGVGAGALALNNGDSNTAVGTAALLLNTSGPFNTAVGTAALVHNDNGGNNTAVGAFALNGNNGGSNTATGVNALVNNGVGSNNTATGVNALASNSSGSFNVAIGDSAGVFITGNGNVCIGTSGTSDVDDTTWIRNVYASVTFARQVYVNADDHIGTLSSSRKYKEEIKPMNHASEALYALRPVTFRYKKEIDPAGMRSFGLIAEEVGAIDPELITCDEHGSPQTVRYDAVNAMLLNEFLKEHRKVQEQAATIAQLKQGMRVLTAQLKAQAAQIQKVSARLELRKPARQAIASGR